MGVGRLPRFSPLHQKHLRHACHPDDEQHTEHNDPGISKNRGVLIRLLHGMGYGRVVLSRSKVVMAQGEGASWIGDDCTCEHGSNGGCTGRRMDLDASKGADGLIRHELHGEGS